MDTNNPTPAVSAPEAPKTEAQPTTNTNEPAQAPAPTPEAPQAPDMHGFTSEQLADMRKFFDANGSFEAVKSKISNPAQPEQPQQQQTPPEQPQQPEQPAQPQPQSLPKGFASLNELNVERYFKDLANDPKYSNISEQIANGDVLKEMAQMGMNPIDDNYNINVNQLEQFLALKSASVPAKQTSAEPTNIPTVEYVPVENETITSTNQALEVLRQSMELEAKGQLPHPAKAKAQEYIQKNGL